MPSAVDLPDRALYELYADPTRTLAQNAGDLGLHPVVLSRKGVLPPTHSAFPVGDVTLVSALPTAAG